MYFPSIFSQISEEIEAVSEANRYFRHILTSQTTRTVKDFIKPSNYRFQTATYTPESVLPATGGWLEHPSASPAQPSSSVGLGGEAAAGVT